MVNSVLYFGAVRWSGNINNQGSIRLDTFIRKANGTVSTEDFWQTHSDLNLTVDELTGVTDTDSLVGRGGITVHPRKYTFNWYH